MLSLRTSYVSPLCAVTLRDVRSIALDRQWTPGMLCATCGCPSISFIMWNVNVPEIQRISITSFVNIVRPVKFGNYSFEHLGFPNDPTKEIMFFNPIFCHKSLTANARHMFSSIVHIMISRFCRTVEIQSKQDDQWISCFPISPPHSASNNHSEYSQFSSISG